jgi:hypothetical protein
VIVSLNEKQSWEKPIFYSAAPERQDRHFDFSAGDSKEEVEQK